MFSSWRSDKNPTRPTSRSSPHINDNKNTSNISNNSVKKYKITIDKDGDAPPILSQLVRYLNTKGAVEHIFQITPPQGKDFQTLRKKLQSEREALLLSSYTKNPHVVAELTKLYLSSLPEPLLTYELYDCFILLNSIKLYQDKLKYLSQTLLCLPRGYYSTLSLILGLLYMISNTERTKMSSESLSEIFYNWFIRPPYSVFYRNNDKTIAQEITEILIYEYEYLFKKMKLKRTNQDYISNNTLTKIPLIQRDVSIRFKDISKMNQNRTPIYYLQQVKDYKDSQNINSLKDDSSSNNNSIHSSTENNNENNDENNQEEEEEEEEFNEEESRKTDEMMGVIDTTNGTIDEDDTIHEAIELENVEDQPEIINEEISHSIMLLPETLPKKHESTPVLPMDINNTQDDTTFEDVAVSIILSPNETDEKIEI